MENPRRNLAARRGHTIAFPLRRRAPFSPTPLRSSSFAVLAQALDRGVRLGDNRPAVALSCGKPCQQADRRDGLGDCDGRRPSPFQDLQNVNIRKGLRLSERHSYLCPFPFLPVTAIVVVY